MVPARWDGCSIKSRTWYIDLYPSHPGLFEHFYLTLSCIALIGMFFFFFGSCSNSSIEYIMACKSMSGAKKTVATPAVKALAQELGVAQRSSSAQRAASGKHATLGEEDHPPAAATQASVPASTPVSVPASVP